MRTALTVSTATLCIFLSSLVYGDCDDPLNEISADNRCTIIRTYKSADVTDTPILVVALHGDSPFNNPGYQYRFAESVAGKSSNVISIGMLRPGYTDPMGRTSDGIRGDAVGDNFDEKRVSQIASAISVLKKQYSPSKVILAGHSGGAAITANLISLFPFLVDHAFIVSCPCDVNAWRKNMFSLTNKFIFRREVKTSSPIEKVGQLSPKIAISMFVGKDDKNTRPVLSETYKDAAIKQGIKVTLKRIEGEHEIFLSPDIINAITEIINNYNTADAADKKSSAADYNAIHKRGKK